MPTIQEQVRNTRWTLRNLFDADDVLYLDYNIENFDKSKLVHRKKKIINLIDFLTKNKSKLLNLNYLDLSFKVKDYSASNPKIYIELQNYDRLRLNLKFQVTYKLFNDTYSNFFVRIWKKFLFGLKNIDQLEIIQYDIILELLKALEQRYDKRIMMFDEEYEGEEI